VRRIVPADTVGEYEPQALVEPAEVALHKALADVPAGVTGLAAFTAAATGLTGPVNTFFDEVLVMAEDADVRRARLGLLAAIRDLAAPVLDWQALGTALG
jgi:glycyl-tRNA synthetase